MFSPPVQTTGHTPHHFRTVQKLFTATAAIAAVAVSAVSGIQPGMADTYEIDRSETIAFLQDRVDAANAAGDTYEIDLTEMAVFECDRGMVAACELAAEL